MDIAKLKGHVRRCLSRLTCAMAAFLGFAAFTAMVMDSHPRLLFPAGIGMGLAIGAGIGALVVYAKDGDAWVMECTIELLQGRLDDELAQSRGTTLTPKSPR